MPQCSGTGFSRSLKCLLPVLLLALAGAGAGNAQPLPANDLREEQLRLVQLLSGAPYGLSFANRPLWMDTYRAALDSLEGYGDAWWRRPLPGRTASLPRGFTAGSWEPVFAQTINSALPHGENNGAAWYGKGLTLELRGGGWITSEWLTVTLRPHLAWQGNGDFPSPRFIARDASGEPVYRAQVPDIDMPFRFGPDPYGTLDWGESSVRVHHGPLEIGYGKESLWWGPARRYPLLLSSNAASLPQLFLGTRSPLPLPLDAGHVEFRLMGAWPKDSDYFEQRPSGGDRFLNGINFAWSPSFVPGFSVGFSRLIYRFVPPGGVGAGDFLDVVLPFSIKDRDRILGGEITGDDATNGLASVWFRWLFSGSGAEIYGEYMKEDTNWDLRDFLMEPHHNRAWTLGAQKIVQSGLVDFFRLGAEVNSLVPGRVDEVRPQSYYYTHRPIRQGHTHRGQVLGAAIGPGSGSQRVEADGYFGRGMAGLFLQRVEHNDFFHFEYYDEPGSGTGYKDLWRNWVELNVGVRGRYRSGPLLISGRLTWNKHYNYGRFNYGELDTDFETFEGFDVVNWHFHLQARYFF